MVKWTTQTRKGITIEWIAAPYYWSVEENPRKCGNRKSKGLLSQQKSRNWAIDQTSDVLKYQWTKLRGGSKIATVESRFRLKFVKVLGLYCAAQRGCS